MSQCLSFVIFFISNTPGYFRKSCNAILGFQKIFMVFILINTYGIKIWFLFKIWDTLLNVTYRIRDFVGMGQKVLVAFYDTVNLGKLLNKLELYGVL